MNLKPVNSINNDSNTIRVSDGNSPIRLIFKDSKGKVINLYDKIDYFYLTKDDEKYYSVTDISYQGDEVIIRLPKLRKGKYKAEIRDKDGSIYPANEDLYILLRRSFEDDKDIYYFGHREDILNSVEPIIIQHIDKNPNKFKGERGQQGFPGRDGLRGIDGKDGQDGQDGKDGEKGDKGDRGLQGIRGIQGIQGIQGIKGNKGDKGATGKDGVITPEQYALINNKIDKGDVKTNDLSPEILELINNSDGTPFEILSIPRDNSVTTKKTDFIEQTHNLFSHEGLIAGKTIDPLNGDTVDSENLSLSDFIPVKEHTDYYVNGTHAYFRYDENKNYITGYSTRNAGTFNTGGTTRYIKLTVLNNHLNGFQMNEGTTVQPYIEYGYQSEITKNTWLSKDSVKSQKQFIESLTPEKEVPFEMTKLLHNSRITPSKCVTYDDYNVRWKDEEKSIKVQTVLDTSKITLSFDDEPFNLMRVSEFLVLLYVEDASKMRSMVLRTGIWQSGASDFKDGWNILRHRSTAGDMSNWETPVNSMYWDIYVKEPTTFYIADVIAVRQDKAKIMFVNDHGYHDFKEIAHPQLKSRGVTTTWAINPGRLGMPLTNGEQILTQEDIEELAIDPYSEFSYHTWNPNEAKTQDMTADELMAETKRCMYYLKKNGLMPRHFWRACFVGNNAPEHTALQPFMDAYASPYGHGSFELYPFRDRYNINRWGIHGRSNEDFDTVFDVLRKTGSMIVFYTHGYSEEGGTHVTPAEFDYFISKIDEGLSGGWIEGTSYDKLRGEFDISDYREIL